MQVYLNVGSDGRILIPKAMRDVLEIKNNSKVIANIEDHTIHITTVHNSLDKARSLVKKYCKSNSSIVDEFLQMRREEAKTEELKFSTKREI